LAAMYGLGVYFGEPETIALNVAALTAAVTYCLACANYKQISYLARAGMVLTALVLGYVTLVIVFKCYYIYLYSRPTDLAIIQQSETLNHNSPNNKTQNFHKTPGAEDLHINWIMPFIPNFINQIVQVSGIYEGIPLVPPLFSNARN
jgi:hypothetical protein